MTVLLAATEVEERRGIARTALAPLAAGLGAEMARLLTVGPRVPAEKAMLSRDGGRCPRDGTALAFDPFSAREHRCPSCGVVYTGERHDRWWVMSYQLWLAERSVHASVLALLLDDDRMRTLSIEILDAYSEQYLRYPNADNALGPTRPFFSTYLESIWLLQLCIAVSLLEAGGRRTSVGDRVRDRVIQPSVALIASFDEGMSNRQTWNDAAMLAAGRVLGDDHLAEAAVGGPSGLGSHLLHALLPDGSWYEGENYHLFAHRALWYGITIAEQAGLSLPPGGLRRFNEGFAAPLATALPDLTYPSRRDSQYAISLRQWRFAESCELGLARGNDDRLASILHALYESDVPRHETGRWRSTADVEHNEPASALSRADLGWRSLVFARAALPAAAPPEPKSALMEGQGIAVLRRQSGRVYAALDYGHSGGGHGHPDRLNLLLARDKLRILDDVGTGSYVDPTLHWYRSTLAHNAPLFDGRSQRRAAGELAAYDERGGTGWVEGRVARDGLAEGVAASRAVIAMPDYLVDRLAWDSTRDLRVELPLHVQADIDGVTWAAAPLDGGEEPTDGFEFVRDTARARASTAGPLVLRMRGTESVCAWLAAEQPLELWRATAPGPPGSPPRDFLIARQHVRRGAFTTVWSWNGSVKSVAMDDELVIVDHADGSRHEHRRVETGWRIGLLAGGARSSIDLGGRRTERREPAAGVPRRDTRQPAVAIDGRGVRVELDGDFYRISEVSWEEAGRPRATVELSVRDGLLQIEIDVEKHPVTLRPSDAPDPMLDNEHPDIHSDGVQLYVDAPATGGMRGWLIVPEEPAPKVRVRAVDGGSAGSALRIRWTPTARGYRLHAALPLAALGSGKQIPLAMDVIVNDMAPGRVRRRGQLVLSGGAGDYVYLQGDRQARSRLLNFVAHRD